ncbi:MAG: hypothetical protein LBV02_08345 [Bacteroidales bacterium]|jgi:LEA14-like dessication related protein|nr:hypothetical protein [Bacteroidales bacterium]
MKKIVALFAFITIFFCGCETLNMINCKYKVQNVANVSWAGINLTGITSVNDLSVSDLAKAALAVTNQDFNVSFDVNVLGMNETENRAKINGFDYVLLLNEAAITSGENSNSVTIDPNGGSATLPINMKLDVANVLSGGTLNDMIDLVKNVTHYGEGNDSDIAVKFSPWIPVGNTIQKMPYITLNHTLQ